MISTSNGPESKLMESGFGSVWAISGDGLEKISESGDSSHITNGNFLDIAVGQKSLFVLEGGAVNQLDEIDPATGKELRHWPLDTSAHSLALSDTDAYVLHSTHPATIDRIDLSSGSSKTYTVNDMADGVIKGEALAFGAGQIWTSSDGTTIYGLDPTSLTIKSTAHVPTIATSVWFGNDSVWTSSDNYHAGIHRIDPATATDIASLLNDAVQVAFSPNGVWLSATDGPTEIDPQNAQVLAAVPSGKAASNYSGGIAVLNDKVFVAYADTAKVQQIQIP